MKLFILTLLTTLFSSFAFSQGLDAIKDNNKGARAFAEDPAIAQRDFLRALAQDPFNEFIKMNLGVSFEATEEYQKSLQAYLSIAEKTNDDKLKHQAYFNAGNASAKLKKIDQALDYYQKALEFDPESKQTKTNIELLTQQQQGEGGGDGEQEEKKDGENGDSGKKDQKKDDSDKGEKPQPDQGQQDQKKKKQPQEFKSQKLTKDDVRKILEELKNQEQDIRAKEFQKGPKERPNEKDW